MVPSYDPELNRIYVGTSVTSPAPKFMLAGKIVLAMAAKTWTGEWWKMGGGVIPPVPVRPIKEPEGAENQPKVSGGYLRGGATLATAGNLVFHNSMAYNAETGEKLW
jgi:hypothetical protein